MRFRTPAVRTAVASILFVAALGLTGCESVAGPAGPGPGTNASPAAADDSRDRDAERAAMECVTGAWVAETPALQAFFDAATAEAGVDDFRIIAEGSIVYEFLDHGFGLTVIPTAFAMRMPTGFGDIVGTISGQASGMWTVRGDYIHASGEGWQYGLTMQWTFMGESIDVDASTQSLADGFTDVDHFACDGDVLVLQSLDGPPLTLTRMVDVG